MSWHYEYNGQSLGPFSENEILDGRIHGETLVWKRGLSGWQPAKTIWPQLQHQRSATGSAPPPPLLPETNLYAAPTSASQFYQAAPSDMLCQSAGLLVCAVNAELPHICVKCGSGDAPIRKTSKLYYYHPAWLLLILLNLLIFLIVVLCIQKKAKINLSLCRKHHHAWLRNKWLGALGFLLGVGLMVGSVYFAGNDTFDPLPLYAGLGLLIGSLVWLIVMGKIISPKKIGTQVAQLKGVAPSIVSGLPQWNAPII